MKYIVIKILAILSKAVLNKYKPQIIAITGSVGKTTTKEAIASILQNKRRIRASYKNYNSEFGVPLTILNQKSAFKSTIGWIKVFMKGLQLIFKTDDSYPEILILEAGIGKPGDMKLLANIIQPDVFIITGIDEMPVHMEFFKNRADIAKEKFILANYMNESGVLIYNYDNELARKYAKKYQGKLTVQSYGFNEKSNIRIENSALFYNPNTNQIGYNFKISQKGTISPLFIPNLLGKYQLYPLAAAIAVGLSMKINIVELAGYLKQYELPTGRMNILKGINNSMIIDDTYNSSPIAVTSAVNALVDLYQYLEKSGNKHRKVFILGDMLELGRNAKKAHRMIGEQLSKVADDVFLVGDEVKNTKDRLEENGFPSESINTFTDAESCAKVIKDQIQEHDLILVKGSQSIRMEKIVEEIMLEKDRKEELLVRQTEEWQ